MVDRRTRQAERISGVSPDAAARAQGYNSPSAMPASISHEVRLAWAALTRSNHCDRSAPIPERGGPVGCKRPIGRAATLAGNVAADAGAEAARSPPDRGSPAGVWDFRSLRPPPHAQL